MWPVCWGMSNCPMQQSWIPFGSTPVYFGMLTSKPPLLPTPPPQSTIPNTGSSSLGPAPLPKHTLINTFRLHTWRLGELYWHWDTGGEEWRCRWFLLLSPSVWDLQTLFEPWSFFCSGSESQSPYSIHLCPPPPLLQPPPPPLRTVQYVCVRAHPSLSLCLSTSVLLFAVLLLEWRFILPCLSSLSFPSCLSVCLWVCSVLCSSFFTSTFAHVVFSL